MTAYMEMIFIDSAGQARKTGVWAALQTDAMTWRAFNRYRIYRIALGEAMFLLDYWNKAGELRHSIPVTADGFKTISGEHVLSEADYLEIDRRYWADIRLEIKAQRFVSSLRDSLAGSPSA